MPTKEPRYNVTLDSESARILNRLAQRKSLSRSMLIKHYITLGIERDEDLELSELANRRDTKGATWMDHDDVWAKLLSH